jgi:putative phosphoribosyl transferase
MMARQPREDPIRTVRIPPVGLEGILGVPAGARGIVLFAHGSGSGRLSPRNNFVAQALRDSGLGTLLFDLLTVEEEADRRNVFDIALLSERLQMATAWVRQDPETARLAIGYFGASTGAAAALVAAAAEGGHVAAVVSRGGRPDLAGPALAVVKAPTLLIVGGDDDVVLDLNRAALAELCCEKQLSVVPGATHLFEEPGALEAVVGHARSWFLTHLAGAGR